MTKSGIYKITNQVNGKQYVGQSIDIFKRWYEHRYKAECKDDISYNSALHCAFRKYGIKSFLFEILEECEIKDLDSREKYWIAKLKTLVPNGYNILVGGRYDKEANKDTFESYAEIKMKKLKFCKLCGKQIKPKSTLCRHCQNKKQKKPLDLDELAGLVFKLGTFGKAVQHLKLSQAATRRKLHKLGLPHGTKELKEHYCNKNGIKLPVKRVRPSWKTRLKPVQQMDSGGSVLMEFESVSAAARSFGKNSGGLVMHLKGRLKSFAGYIWRYKQ